MESQYPYLTKATFKEERASELAKVSEIAEVKAETRHFKGNPPKRTVKYDSEIGVYAISCEETKSVYIGQSRNIPVRLRNHRMCLNRKDYADNYPDWQKDFDTLGLVNFMFESIFNCEAEKLLYWETYYIKLYKAEGWKIYNIQEETNDRTMVTCPTEYGSLISKLVEQLEKGKIKPEQLEQALYYNEMQF